MRFLALLLLALSASAQPAGTGAIGGVVVDSASGDPVRKIVVTLTWHGSPRCFATAMTTGAGRFLFESLPDGSYTLSARDNMTTALVQSPSPAPDYILLASGQRRDDIRISYSRAGSISGAVLDADGDPLQGAQVRLMAEMNTPEGARLRMVSSAQTNERGEYRFRSIGRGRYYVVTGGDGRRGMRFQGQAVDLTNVQFYGGATDWKRAAPIVLKSGEQLGGIDFRMTSAPGVVLRVTLEGLPAEATAQSRPDPTMRMPRVELWPVGDMPPYMNMGYRTGPENRFEFQPAAAGRYRLSANYETDKVLYAAAQEIDLTPEHRDVTIALAPAVTLKGLVKAGPGVSVEGRRVALFRSFGSGGRTSAVVAKDGTFIAPQAAPGLYYFQMEDLPKGAYVRAVRVGGKDTGLQPVEIGLEDPGPVEITVAAKMPSLEGAIDDEAARKHPIAVLLIPATQSASQLPRTTMTGKDGDWKIEAPPGKYKVVGFEPTFESSQLSPLDLAARFDRFAIPVELPEAGGRVDAKPTLLHAAQVDEALR